jgi:hypothetical protein
MEVSMLDSKRPLVVLFLLALAAPVLADDTCNVKAVLAGKPVTMKYCVVALYDSENSVTIDFSDTPFTAQEVAAFQESTEMPEKDATGKTRSSIHFAFCPGGGKPAIDPAAVKLVEMSVTIAGSPFLGFQNTYELPKEKEVVKIEKLSGDLKLGGKLAGRITGGRTADGKKYSWDAAFDMKLPAKSSFAGQGCAN